MDKEHPAIRKAIELLVGLSKADGLYLSDLCVEETKVGDEYDLLHAFCRRIQGGSN